MAEEKRTNIFAPYGLLRRIEQGVPLNEFMTIERFQQVDKLCMGLTGVMDC